MNFKPAIFIRNGKAGGGCPCGSHLPAGLAGGKARRARSAPPAIGNGFSLIEMMITVALLSFIVVGLTAMFVQTQRAFRGGMAQSDVLDAGRAATDLLTRELEQTSAAGMSNVFNFFALTNSLSTLSLPGSAQLRDNQISQFFFLTRNNQTWTGNGYVVAATSNSLSTVKVGTLYHYQAGAPVSDRIAISNLFQNFQADAIDAVNNGFISASLHRVADGIVHLRVQTYSCTPNYYTTNGALILPYDSATSVYNTNHQQNTIFAQYDNSFGQTRSAFTSNAVPAYVNLELGVLEHEAWEKFQSLPAGLPQYRYLTNQAGRVHIFRRHIALPNVDPSAYR